MIRRKHYRRHAAVMVEFAVAAPALFLLILGGIEYVRLNFARHMACNAAYEATRIVVVPGAKALEARQTARDILRRAGINYAKIEFDPPVIKEDTPFVTTTIEIPYREFSMIIGRLNPKGSTEVVTTLRTERAPAMLANYLPSALDPEAAEKAKGGSSGKSGSGSSGSGGSGSGGSGSGGKSKYSGY